MSEKTASYRLNKKVVPLIFPRKPSGTYSPPATYSVKPPQSKSEITSEYRLRKNVVKVNFRK